MKLLIAVRHGETDWNHRDLLQGHADIPLNATGRSQAIELAERLVSHSFDAAISSDLARAKETAEIIQSHRQSPVSLESDYRLREYDFGELDGQPVAELQTRASEEQRALLGVESSQEVRLRISALLQSLTQRQEERYLLSTHGGVILLFYQIAGLPMPNVVNCSAHFFSIEQADGELVLTKANETPRST